MINSNLTSQQLEALKAERKRNIGINISAAALLSGAAYIAGQKILDKKILYNVSKLRYLKHGLPDWYKILGIAPDEFGKAPIPIRAIYLNLIKAAESQLFGIPGSLNTFNLTAHRLFKDADILFTGDVRSKHLLKYADYYRTLTGIDPTGLDLSQQTFRFINNQLFLAEKSATGDWFNKQLLLKYAELDITKFPIVDPTSGIGVANNSRYAANYQSALGVKPIKYSRISPDSISGNAAISDFSYMITGANTRKKQYSRKGHALALDAFKSYLRLMDDPFETLALFMEKAAPGSTGTTNRLRTFSDYIGKLSLRNKFGVGGAVELEDTLPNLIKKHVTRGLPLIAAGFLAYKGINRFLAENTPIEGGISGIGAKAYQNITLGYSYLSEALGLTKLKEKQEEIAPGSTKLGAILAFPLSGIITGGTAAGLYNIFQHVDPHIDPLLEKRRLSEFKLGIKIQAAAAATDSRFGKAGLRTNFLKLAHELFPEKATRVRRWSTIGGLVGLAMSAPFIFGAFGSKRPDELKKIYSGEQLVEDRKGRFWLSGTTPYAGDRTQSFRQHWTVRTISDARAKSIYGDYYGKPITRLFKSIVDPYFLEKINEEAGTRQYDIWGSGDLGLGVFGKIYKHTFGKLIKPTVHFYSNDEEKELLQRTSPYSLKNAINEITSAGFETIGLRGFFAKTLMSKFTGDDEIFRPESMTESSERISSISRQYWDSNLGDIFANSEAIRRLLNKRNSMVQRLQSQRPNNMPSWIPAEFRVGDPYAKLPSGELLLPGKGYEALYPELKGVNLEDYPSVYRLNILSNIAPYSRERFMAEGQVQEAFENNKLTEQELKIYGEYNRQEEIRKREREKQYTSPNNLIGTYWEFIGRAGRLNPVESLLPISPIHKFVPATDPIEQFRDEQLLDSRYKSWAHPIRDFIRPALNKAAYIATFGNFVPKDFEKRNAIEEEFQRLQFIKNAMIKQKILESEDPNTKIQLQGLIERTMFDINPYSKASAVLKYIPRSQRRYFEAFSRENDPERRSKIANIAPNYMENLYNAQWTKDELYDLQDEVIQGKELSSRQQKRMIDLETKVASRNIYNPKITKTLLSEDSSITMEQNLRLPQVAMGLQSEVDSDWIGFNPEIPLRGIKTKLLNQEGYNIHDFDLWGEDEAIADILPYSVTAQVGVQRGVMSKTRNFIYQQMSAIGLSNINIGVNPGNGSMNLTTEVDMLPYIEEQLEESGYFD